MTITPVRFGYQTISAPFGTNSVPNNTTSVNLTSSQPTLPMPPVSVRFGLVVPYSFNGLIANMQSAGKLYLNARGDGAKITLFEKIHEPQKKGYLPDTQELKQALEKGLLQNPVKYWQLVNIAIQKGRVDMLQVLHDNPQASTTSAKVAKEIARLQSEILVNALTWQPDEGAKYYMHADHISATMMDIVCKAGWVDPTQPVLYQGQKIDALELGIRNWDSLRTLVMSELYKQDATLAKITQEEQELQRQVNEIWPPDSPDEVPKFTDTEWASLRKLWAQLDKVEERSSARADQLASSGLPQKRYDLAVTQIRTHLLQRGKSEARMPFGGEEILIPRSLTVLSDAYKGHQG